MNIFKVVLLLIISTFLFANDQKLEKETLQLQRKNQSEFAGLYKDIDFSDSVKIKYINFTPKQIDKVCLDNRIKELTTVVLDAKKAKEMESSILLREYFTSKYEKQRNEIKELSGKLLLQKHISYRGNKEWKSLISSKHIVIENEKKQLYMMYPLKSMTFILSEIPFDGIKKNETIFVYGLKNWIDVKECLEL